MTNAKGSRLLGLSLIGGVDHGRSAPLEAQIKTFVSLYGLNPLQTFMVWEMMDIPANGRPKHLLWSLFLLRQYDCTPVLCHLFNVSPKTWRKWVWPFVEAIAALKVVSFIGWLSSMVSVCVAHHSGSVIFYSCCNGHDTQ